MSNDAGLLETALEPFRPTLTLPKGAEDGWGLSYYQSGEPLLRKQPKAPEGPLDFCERAEGLRTNLILGNRRGRSKGAKRTDNTQPFRFRGWTFIHGGSPIDKFEEIREDLLGSVPSHMQRNIRGNTDSEHLFHLYAAFLNDNNRLDDPRASPADLARGLASTLAYLERLVTDKGGTLGEVVCMATNGRVIVATQRNSQLHVARNSSYKNVGRSPDDRPISHPNLAAVVLVGGPDPVGPGWESVASGAIVTVDSDLNIEYSAA